MLTNNDRQMLLWEGSPLTENPDYLTRQIITYIGNKRSLLGYIGLAVERVKQRLGKSKLQVVDLFSGSGVVSRYLKAHASLLISNDIEEYASVISQCYLRNRSTVDINTLTHVVSTFNKEVMIRDFCPGFIEELYAPRDEAKIMKDDRVFYTRENARRIDNYRRMIEEVDPEMRDLLLEPLLSEASVHANTAGVFKGFYKISIYRYWAVWREWF